MPNNTKARSEFLTSLAMEIIAREKLPLDKTFDARSYIVEIMERGDCHRETARSVFAKSLRRLRYKESSNWGGAGRGQGRKPNRNLSGEDVKTND